MLKLNENQTEEIKIGKTCFDKFFVPFEHEELAISAMKTITISNHNSNAEITDDPTYQKQSIADYHLHSLKLLLINQFCVDYEDQNGCDYSSVFPKNLFNIFKHHEWNLNTIFNYLWQDTKFILDYDPQSDNIDDILLEWDEEDNVAISQKCCSEYLKIDDNSPQKQHVLELSLLQIFISLSRIKAAKLKDVLLHFHGDIIAFMFLGTAV